MIQWFEQMFGLMTQGLHAGDRHLAWHDEAVADAPASLELTSPAFGDGKPIPARHAGGGLGQDLSPPLAWQALPAGTQALALIVEDPDAPMPRPFIHVQAWNIDPRQPLAEGALPVARTTGSSSRDGGPTPTVLFGRNGFGGTGYEGPRSLPFHAPHRYVFQLFALSRPLELEGGASRQSLLNALRGAVLARGQLVGTFERS